MTKHLNRNSKRRMTGITSSRLCIWRKVNLSMTSKFLGFIDHRAKDLLAFHEKMDKIVDEEEELRNKHLAYLREAA